MWRFVYRGRYAYMLPSHGSDLSKKSLTDQALRCLAAAASRLDPCLLCSWSSCKEV